MANIISLVDKMKFGTLFVTGYKLFEFGAYHLIKKYGEDLPEKTIKLASSVLGGIATVGAGAWFMPDFYQHHSPVNGVILTKLLSQDSLLRDLPVDTNGKLLDASLATIAETLNDSQFKRVVEIKKHIAVPTKVNTTQGLIDMVKDVSGALKGPIKELNKADLDLAVLNKALTDVAIIGLDTQNSKIAHIDFLFQE